MGEKMTTIKPAKRRPGRKDVVWTEDMIKLMGTMSDVDLAKVVGCTPTVVGIKRRRLGIEPFGYNGRYGVCRSGRYTEEEIHEIMTQPVTQSAKKHGCSRAAVYWVRAEVVARNKGKK